MSPATWSNRTSFSIRFGRCPTSHFMHSVTPRILENNSNRLNTLRLHPKRLREFNGSLTSRFVLSAAACCERQLGVIFSARDRGRQMANLTALRVARDPPRGSYIRERSLRL